MSLFDGHASLGVGLAVELFALALIPLVLLRRKEPSSTAAWILALLFLPGIGALLFVMFGRDRVRLPVQWKRDSDRLLARRTHHRHRGVSDAMREQAMARLASPVEKDVFRVSAALMGAEARDGNEVTLLVDGAETYEAIGRAIDQAKHHVYAEYYLIRKDRTAAWFRERLVSAAKRGVDVRLMLDGYGSFWISRAWLKPLREAGVRVAFFLPARLLLFQPMNLRNHRKIVIVDGEIGFTGGINIGDEYKGEHGPWRDMHLALRGAAVDALARVFEQDWHFVAREPKQVIAIDETKRPLSHPPPKHGEHPEHGDAVVAIVRSGPDVEGTERETIHKVFFTAITIAREKVYVTTPYFIPDRAIIVALQTAALRGVDVRLIFPSKSNHPVVFQAGRSFYEELLEAGVRIYEYGPGMIHAKTMVVDAAVALVGSANMDLRSFRLNFEVHAAIRDDGTARALEAIFEQDLSRSNEVTLAAFKERPRLLRFVEGFARLLSPLM